MSILPPISVNCDKCFLEGTIPAFKCCVKCICNKGLLLRPLEDDSYVMYVWSGFLESIRVVPKNDETFACHDCFQHHRIHKSMYSICCGQKIYRADVCKMVPPRKPESSRIIPQKKEQEEHQEAQKRPSKTTSCDELLKVLIDMSNYGEKKINSSDLDKVFKERDEEQTKTELIKELKEDSEKQEERIKYLEKLAAEEVHKVKELEEKEMSNMEKLEELKWKNEDIQLKLQEEEQKSVDLMWEVMDKEKELLASEEMVENLKNVLDKEREKNKKIEEELDGLKEKLKEQNVGKKKETDKEVEFLREQVAQLININALLVKRITN